VKVQFSRTFALAAVGLLGLLLIGAFLLGALVFCLWSVDRADHVAPLLTALQVLVPSIAAVAGCGAGSMALRDYGSGGLTSSQAANVHYHQAAGEP